MAIYATKEEGVKDGVPEDRLVEVTEVRAEGSITTYFDMGAELKERLAAARDEWRRLEEAGTPYWCVHKDRGVDHRYAYWKDDTPDDPIHRKHGVMCSECGGYIQEG